MRKLSTIVGIMSLIVFFGVLVSVTDTASAQGHFGGHHGKGFLSNLTDEQRAAVQEKREEMRSQGATREEIHAAVVEMLKGYGIEVPENCPGPMGPGRFGFGDDLTDEQRDAIQEKVGEMRNQSASREEIHAAIAEMLKGYGIEVPDDWNGPPPSGHPWGDFGADLTDEQRQALREKKEELRAQGATREEIHAAIAEMLKGYGIEVPESRPGWHGPGGFGHLNGCFGADLTDEQRTAIREKTGEMQNQGATREEIRSQVDEMLKGYGIEWPDLLSRLTDEQRKAVRDKEREMRREGAECEEILAAVTEMIEGYGLDLSQESQTTPAETTPAELHIAVRTYPNPFNPETQISYTLASSENVQIQIYNVSGQLIRTFDLGYQPAGSYSVKWDGRSQGGDQTASGVYLYRIQAGPYQVTDRMVLLK